MHLEDMATTLGKISGEVVGGERRGRTLGFPTANLRLPDGTGSLAYGVYAGCARGLPAAVSIGVRPTYGDGLEPLAEVHLLDFSGDLYGQHLDVELRAFLRPERAFASSADLVGQIKADIAEVRRVHERR